MGSINLLENRNSSLPPRHLSKEIGWRIITSKYGEVIFGLLFDRYSLRDNMFS